MEGAIRPDLANYYQEDPQIRTCSVSHSSRKADAFHAETHEQLPHLTAKKLAGSVADAPKGNF